MRAAAPHLMLSLGSAELIVSERWQAGMAAVATVRAVGQGPDLLPPEMAHGGIAWTTDDLMT